MMTRTEHLLTILAEECAEVAQRASKALRFGVNEVEPGQEETNAKRLLMELVDLQAVAYMLAEDRVIEDPDEWNAWQGLKMEKVERFLAYSAECGTLAPAPAIELPSAALEADTEGR